MGFNSGFKGLNMMAVTDSHYTELCEM